MHEHPPHEDAGSHHLAFDSAPTAAFAELEGEVMAGLTAEAISIVAEHTERSGLDVRRVLDIGCGPGVASCSLALRFGSAHVLAVDGSAAMLERATARADRLGVASRVATRQLELPAGLGTIGPMDVVWASLVLHHIGDEGDALRRLRRLVEPDGLLAVVELADPVRVMVDDAELGMPGLWERLDAARRAWFADIRAGLPGATTSAGYPALLEEAGWDLLVDEVTTRVLDAPLDARARRFTRELLVRARQHLAPHLGDTDLAALDALADEQSPSGVSRRDDVGLRVSRQLLLARASTGSDPTPGSPSGGTSTVTAGVGSSGRR